MKNTINFDFHFVKHACFLGILVLVFFWVTSYFLTLNDFSIWGLEGVSGAIDYTPLVSNLIELKHTTRKLNPKYVSGLIDGEGSFSVMVTQRNTAKANWRVQVVFQISLHKRDRDLLNLIQDFFSNVGAQYVHSEDMVSYRVYRVEDLKNVIIPHFDKFPLQTHKRADFELFKMAL